jgi:hypothetical protein
VTRNRSNALFLIILAIGAVMRLWQYFMGRSLWEDETHLALNIINHGFLRLLEPLDYIQGAPVLFLWLVKLFGVVLGYGEASLRATPFLFSLLTLPLLYYVILDLTGNRAAALIGFFIYSVNITLVYFSSELKPYAVDVSFYILLVYLWVSVKPWVARHRNRLLLIAGVFSVFLSLSAFVVLICIGCCMLMGWIRSRQPDYKQLKVMLAWAGAVLVNYFVFVHNHPSTMLQRENYAADFCPLPLFGEAFMQFLAAKYNDVFFSTILKFATDPFTRYLVPCLLVFSIVHFSLRRNFMVLFLIIMPVLIHLVLSMLQIYPFVYRLILYLMPAMIMLVAYGAGVITTWLSARLRYTGLAVALPCIALFSFSSFKEFPSWEREIKPTLDFVNDSTSAKHVYVFDPINAYTYYEKRGYAKKPVYRGMPWNLSASQFYEMISMEKENYLVFYNWYFKWGYGSVIDDLWGRGLIVKNYRAKGYEVSEVKPVVVESDALVLTLDHTYFNRDIIFGNERYIPLWSNEPVTSSKFSLKKGRYSISVYSGGSEAGGAFPHNLVMVGDSLIGAYTSRERFGRADIHFDIPKDTNITVTFKMDNDYNGGGQDRNTLILFANIYRLPE